MNDEITKIGNSILQHGKYNDRIYLMKLSRNDLPHITDRLERLASSGGYSKIIAKVPEFAKGKFKEKGYLVEASIPGFYNGIENVHFMGKYFSGSRVLFDRFEKINEILKIARLKEGDERDSRLSCDFDHKICDISDVSQMADVYKKVFETYPFPIHDPYYLRKTMKENFVYFGIWKNCRIVALSSSEMDNNSQNVEMTDFATLPEHQGNGLAIHLLQRMEEEMQKRNMKVAYTIARACSYGINIIFARSGYNYGGTLINNTNISGDLESMNVWYKYL